MPVVALDSPPVGNSQKYARDQIVPVFGFLQTPERHLGAGDVFLGVFQIFKLALLSESEVRGSGDHNSAPKFPRSM
jgi:hypothetical protein